MRPSGFPSRCGPPLADRSNLLLVSAVSALEIATKVRIGKLDAADLATSLPRRIDSLGAEQLSVTLEHAVRAGSMTWAHRDPFDRLLVAQASLEDATLVTVDSAIAALPVPQVLTW